MLSRRLSNSWRSCSRWLLSRPAKRASSASRWARAASARRALPASVRSSFSCAEILAALYYGVMRLRRGEPDWPDRDRLLLGKGHAAAALYPLLADWEFFPASWLDEYTRLGNAFGDHPDMRRIPGIDFSSGSLGHALSAGLGMALGGDLQGRDFTVFVLLGDGELHEGQVWEAALAAAHYRMGNLEASNVRQRPTRKFRFHIAGSTDPLDRRNLCRRPALTGPRPSWYESLHKAEHCFRI